MDKPFVTNMEDGYPLEKLTPRKFEELLAAIFEEEKKKSQVFDYVELMQGVAERGRDCSLYKDGKAVGAIQCKHTRIGKRNSQTDVGIEIIKFILHAIQDEALIADSNQFTYYYATSSDVSEEGNQIFRSNTKFATDHIDSIEKWTTTNLNKYKKLELAYSKSLLNKVATIFKSMTILKWSAVEIKNKIIENEEKIAPLFFPVKLVEVKKSSLPKALTANPANPDFFIGRAEDLTKLYDNLHAGDNMLMMVNGQGGIGKSSLAAKYYLAHGEEYKHTAWLLNKTTIAETLLELMPILLPNFNAGELDVTKRMELLLRELAKLPAQSLIVIDNANNHADILNNKIALQRCANINILMTSRAANVNGVREFKIEGLNEKFGVELFKEYYKGHNPEDDDLLFKIIEYVEKNTLVIELLAKNLQVQNELKLNYSLTTLYKDIQQNLIALSESGLIGTAYQSDGIQERIEKPEDIVLAMYNIGELSEPEQKMISIFAVLPNQEINYSLLESLLDDEKCGTQALLLAKKGWIDYNQEVKTFKINQVVQDVIQLKQKERLLADSKTLISNLGSRLDGDDLLHKDYYLVSLELIGYAEAIIRSIPEADHDLATLCQNVGRFYEKKGSLIQAKGSLIQALAAYETMHHLQLKLFTDFPDNSAFKNGLAISYSKLGETQRSLGNLEKALDYFQQRSVIGKELYDSYPENVSFKNGLAISYSKLGETQSSLGNLEKALIYFEDETVLFEELYSSYPANVSFKNGLAVSYSKLGETQSSLGDLEKALEYFEQYSTLEKELHSSYPENVSYKNGLAISYSKLGDTHSSLGNLEKALEYFEQCSVIGEELYSSYPENVSFKNGLAISYEKLGKTHNSLGNLEKALDYFEQRSVIGKELYDSYPENVSFKNGLAVSYSKLGDLYKEKRADNEKAKFYFQKCFAIWQELTTDFPNYAEFKNNFGWVTNKLAELNNLEA